MEYRFAPMSEVVDTATLICAGATDEDRSIFRQWSWLGVMQLGPTKHWIKTCSISNKGGFMRKPKDFASLISLGLYDSSDRELQYEFYGEGGRVHIDRATTHAAVGSGEMLGRVDLSEDGYNFILGSNGTDVDHALIRYLALPVDSNGEILVPEDNIFALTTFIRWNWAMRKGDNQAEIQMARDTWYREKDRIFGDNKMPSYFDAKEFGKKYLSLIQGYKPDRF